MALHSPTSEAVANRVCVCIPMKKDITSCSANKVKRPESLFFPGIYWIFQKVKMSFIHETKESHNIGLK